MLKIYVSIIIHALSIFGEYAVSMFLLVDEFPGINGISMFLLEEAFPDNNGVSMFLLVINN